MYYSNNPLNNSIPVEANLNHHPVHGAAGNAITIRGDQINEYMPTKKKASRNMAEASQGTLRFFRKVCRLMPFILRIHQLQSRLTDTQGMLNVAKMIKLRAHVRDPGAVDQWVYRGYELLQQAEWHYLQREHLYRWLSPAEEFPGHLGYSYLETQKLKGKTGFLRDFYKGSKSAEY